MKYEIFRLAGGNALSQYYILGPRDNRVHIMKYSIENEANLILKRADIQHPLKEFLKRDYCLVKVENSGSPLPFNRAVYSCKLWISVDSIIEDKPNLEILIKFQKFLDISANDTLLPWQCKVYYPKSDSFKTVHGLGSRFLRLALANFKTHNPE